jgi:hypothetical protein
LHWGLRHSFIEGAAVDLGGPHLFFFGGAAGASALIGGLAHLTGKDKRLARDARLVAAGGAIVSTGLLISDLGRPERFLNMLRVFKIQSPMSVGAWVLALFGSASGAAEFAQLVEHKSAFGPIRVLGNIAEGFSAALGLPLATYTGVLIDATAIPAWNRNIKRCPYTSECQAWGRGFPFWNLWEMTIALRSTCSGSACIDSELRYITTRWTRWRRMARKLD